MPLWLDVPKVASVPVIEPTSPILITAVSAEPTFPPPCCSLLQPMATASTQTRNFADMRRMVGSEEREKASLLNIPLRGDQQRRSREGHSLPPQGTDRRLGGGAAPRNSAWRAIRSCSRRFRRHFRRRAFGGIRRARGARARAPRGKKRRARWLRASSCANPCG